jgi:hypothetical protein
METTMRLLCAILILLSAVTTASAEIRINESRYVDGKLLVAGDTRPDSTVTLDNKFKTKSDGEGHFKFSVGYKPPLCMSDISANGDVYSAVIAGCYGVTTDAMPDLTK